MKEMGIARRIKLISKEASVALSEVAIEAPHQAVIRAVSPSMFE